MFQTADKTPEIIEAGYDPDHFGDDYWLKPLPHGHPRISRSSDQLLKLLNALIKARLLPKKPRIIDVGAGPGQAVAAFRDAGFESDGCEFSPSGRRIAKEKFGIDLMDGDLRSQLQAKSGDYQFATCVGVLTMIPKKFMANAMKELARVLCRSGILHVLLNNPTKESNPTHLTAFSRETWGTYLSDAGFQDVTKACNPKQFGIGVRDEEFCGVFKKIRA